MAGPVVALALAHGYIRCRGRERRFEDLRTEESALGKPGGLRHAPELTSPRRFMAAVAVLVESRHARGARGVVGTVGVAVGCGGGVAVGVGTGVGVATTSRSPTMTCGSPQAASTPATSISVRMRRIRPSRPRSPRPSHASRRSHCPEPGHSYRAHAWSGAIRVVLRKPRVNNHARGELFPDPQVQTIDH